MVCIWVEDITLGCKSERNKLTLLNTMCVMVTRKNPLTCWLIQFPSFCPWFFGSASVFLDLLIILDLEFRVLFLLFCFFFSIFLHPLLPAFGCSQTHQSDSVTSKEACISDPVYRKKMDFIFSIKITQKN